MDKLLEYIKSTFNYKIDVDAKQYSPEAVLKLLSKDKYYIYILPITFPHLKYKQQEYNSFVKKAAEEWSRAINNKIIFEITDEFTNADIKVYWVKSSINFLGMQYTENIGNYEKLCVSIGVLGTDYTPLDNNLVYNTILHEFGHIMGLGHSPKETDVMYHIVTNNEISYNDKLVLNLIYSIGTDKSYSETKHYIEKYILKQMKKEIKIFNSELNLFDNLSNIANMNKSLLRLKNL